MIDLALHRQMVHLVQMVRWSDVKWYQMLRLSVELIRW